ncbi:hypothetical protein HNY73_020934 [Argiope bruennichi]|uniref:Uncharacterized protein n=1 Tax=Argiope bruennichi TaxID=94029 RepID=A0A8T0E8D0_ARGBR|nr:hypothetical protein HNY73_020934 [Argiope bruennichi]
MLWWLSKYDTEVRLNSNKWEQAASLENFHRESVYTFWNHLKDDLENLLEAVAKKLLVAKVHISLPNID